MMLSTPCREAGGNTRMWGGALWRERRHSVPCRCWMNHETLVPSRLSHLAAGRRHTKAMRALPGRGRRHEDPPPISAVVASGVRCSLPGLAAWNLSRDSVE